MNQGSEFGRRGTGRALWLSLLVCGACGTTQAPSDMNGGSGGVSSSGGSAGDGGSASGGQPAATGGQESGGASSGGGGSGGTGGHADSCVESTQATLPTAARSATFSGTDSEYSELYNQLCVTEDDCVAPCAERGGTEEFCAAHVCIDSTDDYCLPPTKWRSVVNALQEGESQTDAAESSLDPSTVGFQDRLILENFGFSVPAEATIVGVTALVKRAYSSSEPVVDYSVRLVIDGEEVGADLKRHDVWSEETFEEVEYGGEAELWGEQWSPAQVNSESFGIAIGALPLAGGRAYVDVVRLVVHYDFCE